MPHLFSFSLNATFSFPPYSCSLKRSFVHLKATSDHSECRGVLVWTAHVDANINKGACNSGKTRPHALIVKVIVKVYFYHISCDVYKAGDNTNWACSAQTRDLPDLLPVIGRGY